MREIKFRFVSAALPHYFDRTETAERGTAAGPCRARYALEWLGADEMGRGFAKWGDIPYALVPPQELEELQHDAEIGKAVREWLSKHAQIKPPNEDYFKGYAGAIYDLNLIVENPRRVDTWLEVPPSAGLNWVHLKPVDEEGK